MGNDTALALNGRYAAYEDDDGDKYTKYNVIGDYYLSRYISIGLQYGQLSSDGPYLEYTSMGLHFSMYFTEKFNIDVTYTANSCDASTNTTNLQVGAYLLF